MLCIQKEQLATIKTALCELLDRQHLDLHPDDRAMLDEAVSAIRAVEKIVATPEQRAKAEKLHANNELEVDDDASVSEADDGYWVSAWVWVLVKPDACEDCGNTLNDGSDVCDQCGGAFVPQED